MKFWSSIIYLRNRLFGSKILKVILFCALAFIPLLVTAPGYLSKDEGTYHMMVKNLADGFGFEIWNGYQEFPSRELISGSLVIAKDRLVAMPPDLFSLAALPFYMLFGYRGLFFLNAVAFLGILALIYLVASRFFGDSKLATNACLIAGFSTYLWDYSQAAWPHATSTLFILAAFYAMARAFYSESGSHGSIWWAVLAGLLGGWAPGMRLDAAFAIPVLIIPLLFKRPPRWSAAFAVGLGLLPGFVTLSLLNNHKFGTFSPFSYGLEGIGRTSSLLPYLPLATAGFLFLLILRILAQSSIRGKRIVAMAIIIGSGAGLINMAAVYTILEQLATGGARLLIDLRFHSLDLSEPGLSRSPTGGFVYIDGFKKSILQSCPYIAALIIPLIQMLRRGRDAKAITLLLFLPACFIGVYSYFSWHGGQCLNLRYLVPALPFIAILAAYAWRELTHTLRSNWLLIGFIAFIASALIHSTGLDRANSKAGINEFFLLSLPLLMAAVLTVLLAMVTLDRKWQFASRWISGFRTCAAIICLAAMVWAGSVVFFYDYPLQLAERESNHNVAAEVSQVISDDSIIFATHPDPYFGLIERSNIRIAVPTRDRFKDFRRIVTWHLSQGRSVYAAFGSDTWQQIQNRGLLKGWIIQEIIGDGILSQIQKSEQ